MNVVTKTLLILAAISLAGIATLILVGIHLSELGSTYKFGIIADNYSNVIAERPRYLAVNKNVNKYSWMTPIILPDSQVKIELEHLVVANKVDIELIPEITNHAFLLTMIECPHDKVISISITNNIDGTTLPMLGAYLYAQAPNTDQRKWCVRKINTLTNLNTQNKYRALALVFPFPDKVPKPSSKNKKHLFHKANQYLRIEYLDKNNKRKTIKYSFEIDWYKSMSGWDKIVTIT